jgi:hypothetical protein
VSGRPRGAVPVVSESPQHSRVDLTAAHPTTGAVHHNRLALSVPVVLGVLD